MRLPRAWAAIVAVAAASLAALGCAPDGGSGAPQGAAATSAAALAAGSASQGPAAALSGGRLAALRAAEHRRAAAEVAPADQQHRDPQVRRAAARALARIGGDAARAGLLRGLSDEDDDVVAWAAYGLGFSCQDHEAETVSALVARALSREVAPPAKSPAPRGAAAAPRLDPAGAMARAVGRCAAETSEPTLVAWLSGPRERAAHAAYALGDLAAKKGKLREETFVALLNVAAGSAAAPPLSDALYPIGRVEHAPLTVLPRIRDVAAARLAEPGDARLFAVRALGRAGAAAAGDLVRVLTTAGVFSAAERAEAARALKRLGRAGRRALAGALPALVPSPDPVALAGLVGEDLGVLLTALESLDAAPGDDAFVPAAARKPLRELAALPPPPSAPLTITRRVTWIRCLAARVVAGANYRDPLLLGCDVMPPAEAAADASAADAGAADAGAADGGVAPAVRAAPGMPAGTIGARAVVEVIGRGEITGARLAAWRVYAEAGELRAREAAIGLLAEHGEIEGAPAVLAASLAAEEPGLVGAAAEVIAKQPQRASEPAKRPAERRRKRGKRREIRDVPPPPQAAATPSPAVVAALRAVLDRPAAAADPELIDTVIDALGALAVKEAEPRLDALCRSSYPTTRAHAEKALGLLRGGKATCATPDAAEAPAELSAIPPGPVALDFDTDAGAMTVTLDPALAPVAVARFVELARAGYYNGMIVHRVVPGFVTQLGAPYGDGAGGPPGKPALRCETSPLPFDPLRVGIALAGRDTGSSQLFVMHARAPHLDGQYALIGTAAGPWAAFVDGDLVRGVKVRD